MRLYRIVYHQLGGRYFAMVRAKSKQRAIEIVNNKFNGVEVRSVEATDGRQSIVYNEYIGVV